jgi:hypothetical protein
MKACRAGAAVDDPRGPLFLVGKDHLALREGRVSPDGLVRKNAYDLATASRAIFRRYVSRAAVAFLHSPSPRQDLRRRRKTFSASAHRPRRSFVFRPHDGQVIRASVISAYRTFGDLQVISSFCCKRLGPRRGLFAHRSSGCRRAIERGSRLEDPVPF